MDGIAFPDAAFFINHEASELKNLAVSFTISPYSLSENWEKKWDIFLTQKIPEENFIKDASDSLKRFRFRKIGKRIPHGNPQLPQRAQDLVNQVDS